MVEAHARIPQWSAAVCGRNPRNHPTRAVAHPDHGTSWTPSSEPAAHGRRARRPDSRCQRIRSWILFASQDLCGTNLNQSLFEELAEQLVNVLAETVWFDFVFLEQRIIGGLDRRSVV